MKFIGKNYLLSEVSAQQPEAVTTAAIPISGIPKSGGYKTKMKKLKIVFI